MHDISTQQYARACEDLFLQHREQVFRRIHKTVEHTQTAEDLTQEIFLHLSKRIASLMQNERNLEAWLLGSVQQVLTQWHVARRVQYEVFVGHAMDGRENDQLSDLIPAIALREEVRLALEQLKPVRRTILFLSHVHGFSFQEIGEVLSHSPKEIRKMFMSTCHSLRDRLAHIF